MGAALGLDGNLGAGVVAIGASVRCDGRTACHVALLDPDVSDGPWLGRWCCRGEREVFL